jgi:hypothetical protein
MCGVCEVETESVYRFYISLTVHLLYKILKIRRILRILYNILYVLDSDFIVTVNNTQDIAQYLNQY